MEVIGYLRHSDLIVEDENGVAVIGGGRYVLSLGDQIYIQHMLDPSKEYYQVNISFACHGHTESHADEMQLKFIGSREGLKAYLKRHTVH